MRNIYLAMYKDKGDWVDKVIRLFTGKPYSHCEIVVQENDGYYWYSSSPRDGGVRVKKMPFNDQKWDLIPLPNVSGKQVRQFYTQTVGLKYDFFGAIGCVLPLPERKNRWFCSEWCYTVIFGQESKKPISPNELAKLVREKQ